MHRNKFAGGFVTRGLSDKLDIRDKSAINNENMSNQRPYDLAPVAKISGRTRQRTEELHEPSIRKFEKRKKYLFLKDNIWGADSPDN